MDRTDPDFDEGVQSAAALFARSGLTLETVADAAALLARSGLTLDNELLDDIREVKS